MAAIEKICEFSGDYPAGAMYGYKHNHLQIVPKYRKEFRGATATLHFFKEDQMLVAYDNGRMTTARSYHPSEKNAYKPSFANEKEYLDYMRTKYKRYLTQRYWFVLEVQDERLMGDVEGEYANTTYNPKVVIRRMKRLTRNYNLKAIFHNCSYDEWDDEREKMREHHK